MKMQKMSLVLASIMAANSLAFGMSASEQLKQGTANIGSTSLPTNAAMADMMRSIVDENSDVKMAQLIETRDQLVQILNTMNAIRSTNENDTFLKTTNYIQVFLAAATSTTLALHLGAQEKRRMMLTISAVSAVLNSSIKFYKDRSSVGQQDVHAVLNKFTQALMADQRAYKPEIAVLVGKMSEISNSVLNSQSSIEKIIGKSSDASYIATVVIVGLAVAHWYSPKMGKEAEAAVAAATSRTGEVLKDLKQFADQSKKVTSTSAVGSVLPEIIGNALGLNAESSQKLIAETANNLTGAIVNFQTQINVIQEAAKSNKSSSK